MLYPEDVLSVEFRHRSWYQAEAYGLLRERLRQVRIGLTVVD